MNCGCPPQNQQVNIVQGQDKTFQVNLFFTDTGQPFDLTSATEIKAYLPGTEAAVIKTLTGSGGVTVVGAPGAGLIQVALSEADTLLLLVNPNGNQFQDLQVKVTIGGAITTFIIGACLNILAQPYADPVP